MLYEKSRSKSLDLDLFKNPTSEYRGAPFWAWNCDLNEGELLWQIEELKKMGFGGAHMHVRQGLSTEYMGDEFLNLIASCVKKAKQEKMKAYLYDEDMWPSGFAGGKVTCNKKYRQKYLNFSNEKLPSVDIVTSYATGERVFISAYDIELDTNGEMVSYKRIGEDDVAVYAKKYIYLNTEKDEPRFNNQAYVDTLSKEAIDKFIKETHVKYKEKIGEHFGDTVPSIFTDEPQHVQTYNLPFATSDKEIKMPWTLGYDLGFKQRYGYDILDKLPELFWDKKGQEFSQVRYHFQDYTCQLFTENFAKNIGTWCDENGIALTGHMMREDYLQGQTCAIGEAMRAYRYFGVPGIDLLCNEKHFNTAKQCQSMVHQCGKEGMLSELYGVTDWTFDFRGHKYQGDWQAALGVTLRVPHLSWVSMKGPAKRDYPASINYQSPWYKEYRYIEDHFARVNTILTRGKPVVKVAVVHPIESYWLYYGTEDKTAGIRQKLEDHHEKLTDWLLGGLIDFDFLCESDMEVQTIDAGKTLKVGQMEYDTVIIPGNVTIRKNTLNVLNKFADNGGKLLILGDALKCVEAVPSKECDVLVNKAKIVPFEELDVLNALEEDALISIKNETGKRSKNLLYALRQDGDAKWLFIAHKDVGFRAYNQYSFKDLVQPQNFTLTIKGQYKVTLYDTVNGEIVPLPYDHVEGNTVIDYTIYESDSVMLLLEPCDEVVPAKCTVKKVLSERRLIEKPTLIREEGNVLLLDEGEYKFDDGEWKGFAEINQVCENARYEFNYPGLACQPWVIPAGEFEHSITMRYTFDSTVKVKGAYLCTEDAELAEIYLNGKKVVNNIDGYFVDKSISKIPLGAIKKGKNVLTIKIPYGRRSFIESSYIIGDFDVKVSGVNKTIVAPSSTIGYGNIVDQGMPFYGGNICYKQVIDVEMDGDYEVLINAYRGATLRAYMDGKDLGILAFAPYFVKCNLTAGKHELVVKLYGNRKNTFGSLHHGNKAYNWYGPDHWYPSREEFRYEYILAKTGVLASPILRQVEYSDVVTTKKPFDKLVEIKRLLG